MIANLKLILGQHNFLCDIEVFCYERLDFFIFLGLSMKILQL
jgi:hypothetical protein